MPDFTQSLRKSNLTNCYGIHEKQWRRGKRNGFTKSSGEREVKNGLKNNTKHHSVHNITDRHQPKSFRTLLLMLRSYPLHFNPIT